MFRNTQRHMLRHPTSIALTAIVNSVTADGCIHITEYVGSRRELVANSCTHRRRRRDATRQFRRVGGVYWAIGYTCEPISQEETTCNQQCMLRLD